jgi:hypothetical protein
LFKILVELSNLLIKNESYEEAYAICYKYFSAQPWLLSTPFLIFLKDTSKQIHQYNLQDFVFNVFVINTEAEKSKVTPPSNGS